jgi:hypothetical protein
MFQPTEANVSCNNLFVAVTYEHVNSTLSSTHIQSIGGGGKMREPSGGIWIPPGLWCLTAQELGLHHPGYTEAGSMHHPVPQRAPGVISWLGADTIQLNTGGTQ